jgi:hypothetical protein
VKARRRILFAALFCFLAGCGTGRHAVRFSESSDGFKIEARQS